MKRISFILALVIFSTSLKASAFVGGVISALSGENTSYSCCKVLDDSDVKECDSEEDQEEGCCEGDSCNCTCCLHVVYLQQLSTQSNAINEFSEVKFGYSFLYQADYLKSVFHPPAFL